MSDTGNFVQRLWDLFRPADSSPRTRLELARSNRSKCRICKNTIPEGELRLGIVLQQGNHESVRWYHLVCFACPG